RAVAIIGQSNDAGKTAGRPLKYLRQAGYAGRIYPVNARRDSVLGERAWPSLAELPEKPDHGYIVARTEGVVGAVEDCGRAGVAVATILADGFGEAGDTGAKRVAQLRDICARTGVRLVGPSSLGVVNLRDKVLLTANAAFAEPDLPVGKIFAASHSGSLIGALVSRGKARGIGLPGWARAATKWTSRSAKSAPRRSTIPTSTATRCSSRPCATPGRCAPSRWQRRRGESRSSPTSSGARRRRASLRCRIPARSPARTTWRPRSWPI